MDASHDFMDGFPKARDFINDRIGAMTGKKIIRMDESDLCRPVSPYEWGEAEISGVAEIFYVQFLDDVLMEVSTISGKPVIVRNVFSQS